MADTKTPIIDRSDESLVRRIAKQMGLQLYIERVSHINTVYWGDELGLAIQTVSGLRRFKPHLDSGSDDHEQVCKASGVFWQHIEKNGYHIWSWYDMADETAGWGRHKDSGRAFVEAEVKRIGESGG